MKGIRKNRNERQNDACQNLTAHEFINWLKENPRPIMSEAEHWEKVNACLIKAKETNAARIKVFCPMVRDRCDTSCECYAKATVHGTIYEKDTETGNIPTPRITGGYCTDYSMKGPA